MSILSKSAFNAIDLSLKLKNQIHIMQFITFGYLYITI